MDDELAAHLERVNAKRKARATTPPPLAGCPHDRRTAEGLVLPDDTDAVWTCDECGWHFTIRTDDEGRTILTGVP